MMRFLAKDSKILRFLAVVLCVVMLVESFGVNMTSVTNAQVSVAEVNTETQLPDDETEVEYTVTVTDEESNPIEGAEVSISVSDYDEIFKAETDEDGIANFAAIAEYFAENASAEDAIAEVTVTADGYETRNFSDWTVSATESLIKEVTLTASQAQEPELDDIAGITITPKDDVVFEENKIYSVDELVDIEGIVDGDKVYCSETGEDGSYDALEDVTFDAPGKYTVYFKVQRDGFNDWISDKTELLIKAVFESDDFTVESENKKYKGSAYHITDFVTVAPKDSNLTVLVLYCDTVDGEYKTADDFDKDYTAIDTYHIYIKVQCEGYEDWTSEIVEFEIIEGDGSKDLVTTTVNNKPFKHENYLVTDFVTIKKKTNSNIVIESISYSDEENGEYSSATEFSAGKFINAGSYTVWVKVKCENYTEFSFSVEFKIEEVAGSEDLVTKTVNNNTFKNADYLITDFVTIEKNTANADKNIVIESISYSDTKDGSYSASVADLNPAGEYTVWVKVKCKNYTAFKFKVTFKIENAEMEAKFGETPDKVYCHKDGTFQYAIASITGVNSEDLSGSASIKYSYNFDDIENPLGVTEFDDKTGKVVYNIESLGMVNVVATITAENYDEYEISYTIEVVYLDDVEINLSDPDHIQQISENDKRYWYGSNAIISVPNHTIVEKDSEDYAAAILKDSAGIYDAVEVRAMDAEGYLTNWMTVQKFAIDTTNPEIVSFKVHEVTVLERVVHFLTFGIFANDSVKVTVTVDDDGNDSNNPICSSGIDEICLVATAGENTGLIISPAAYDETKNSATFTVPYENVVDGIVLDIKLAAQVTDNVGHESGLIAMTSVNYDYGDISDEEKHDVSLKIETVVPSIKPVTITPSDCNSYNTDDKKFVDGIYDGDVEISYDVTDVDSGIYSIDVKVNGESVVAYCESLTDDTKALENGERIISTAGIDPDADGKYDIEITATDCAGNTILKTITVYKDLTAPVISEFKFIYDGNDISNEALVDATAENPVDITYYGYYFKENVIVSITAEDLKTANEAVVGLSKIFYKAIDVDGNVVKEGCEEVSGDKATIEFEIEKSFKGQIYAYAEDLLGNSKVNGDRFNLVDGEEVNVAEEYNTELVTDNETLNGYVHPNGAVIESEETHAKEDHITFEKPETTFKQNDGTELYAGDVDVTITITDTYSGIRDITWEVIAPYDTDNNQSGNVTVKNDMTLDGDDGWTYADEDVDVNLLTKLTKTITVNNDSNDIVIKVKMTDRAGNTSEKEIKFGIDKTAPQIEIEYDNNEPDEEYTDYYDKDRTATITITERNFSAKDVVFKITNTDGILPDVDLTKDAVWQTVANADPDLITHIATVKYSADGDYTFDISYKDNAANAANVIEQNKFTIDKTLPVVTVTYDNNSAKNGNYYKAERTATITVKEHNFDAARVNVMGTADDVSFPSISKWTSNGDVHTATIHYAEDAKYTFDFDFKDMAGNQIVDFAKQEFHVDTTAPVVSISGIVDKSANAQSGNIGYVVSSTDKNFDEFATELSAIVKKEDGTFATEKLDLGVLADITNGKSYTVTNIETDGIYSITCTVVDKAGNEFTEVILEDASGAEQKEQRSGADTLAMFSVNRSGSTFNLNEYTNELVKTYYVQNVTENVTIIEINADSIKENTVTLNGKTLTEGTDYTVTLANDAGSWYKYTYSLNKSLFDAEGEYIVVVSSVDKADNKAFSDVKDMSVKFVVDRTAPTVTVTGMKTDGRYQVDKQVVTLVPSDDGGSLKSLIVRTVDENGKVIEELVSLSDEALAEALAEGKITFEIAEGLYQNVQVICEDYAGNISGAADSDIYENISVSSNAFMIFWANQPLRYGTIAGVALLIVGAVVAIILIKRKKKG